MKKIILATLLFGFTMGASAQYTYTLEDALISSITVKEGKNTLLTKHGKGTLEFVKSGERFSNINFKDAQGRSHTLTAVPANTPGLRKPDCTSATQLTCFVSKNKDIAVFICKQDPLAGQPGTLTMTCATSNGADRYSIKNFKLGQ